MTDGVVRSLQGIALLAGLTAEAHHALEQACHWRQLAPGQRLIHQDDTSDDVFFLVGGSLRVITYAANGKAVLFRSMQSGAVIGELSAIDGQPRSASVEATTPALVAQLRGAAFRDLVASEPTVAVALLRQTIAYVRELSARVHEFSSLAVTNRIHAELLRLGRRCENDDGTAVIDPAPRHSDIASRISTHREAVSREMSRLVRLGLLQRRGKALVIRDITALAALAGRSASAHKPP